MQRQHKHVEQSRFIDLNDPQIPEVETIFLKDDADLALDK